MGANVLKLTKVLSFAKKLVNINVTRSAALKQQPVITVM